MSATLSFARVLLSSCSFIVAIAISYFVLLTAFPPESSVEYHNTYGTPLADTSEAEIVLLGSSRFVFGIDVETFQSGVGMKVVNASRTAMRLEEMGELIEYFVRQSPNAKFFVLELMSPIPEPQYRTTKRQTAWHSVDSTWMLIQSSWAEDTVPIREKVRYTRRHLQLLALRYRIYGSASPSFSLQAEETPPGRVDDSWRAEHGKVLKEVINGEHRRRYSRSKGVADFYAHLIGLVRTAGAEPIFVTMPQAYENDLAVMSLLHEYVSGCDIIDLSSPTENLKLYDIELWIDPYHVGGDGATLLSQKLAAEFLKVSRS